MTDLLAEPVSGFRIWRFANVPSQMMITPDDLPRIRAGYDPFQPSLIGVGYNDAWVAEHHETAACKRSGRNHFAPHHDAPARGCKCGLWILHKEHLAQAIWEYCLKPSIDSYSRGYVFGEVQGWGRMIEHQKGWRCQYARPTKLTVVNGDDALVAALSKRYGIPAQAGETPPEAIDFSLREPNSSTGNPWGMTTLGSRAAQAWVTQAQLQSAWSAQLGLMMQAQKKAIETQQKAVQTASRSVAEVLKGHNDLLLQRQRERKDMAEKFRGNRKILPISTRRKQWWRP